MCTSNKLDVAAPRCYTGRMKTFRPRLAAISSALLGMLTAYSAAAQTSPTPHFYSLGAPHVTLDQAGAVAKSMGLTQQMDQTGRPLPVWAMGDGSVRLTFIGGRMHLNPDLRGETNAGPTTDVALRFANAFVSQFGLNPDSFQWGTGFTGFNRAAGSPTGIGATITPIRGVRYQRMLDGMKVFGPNSLLTVFVDAKGVVGALAQTKPVTMLSVPVVQKTPAQLQSEFMLHLQPYLLGGHTYKLVAQQMCYVEGTRYLVPAVRYDVTLFNPGGLSFDGEHIYVPLAINSPEPLTNSLFTAPSFGFQPIFGTLALPDAESNVEPPAPVGTVKLGEYIITDYSDSSWYEDATNYFVNAEVASLLHYGFNRVNRTQYFWNQDALWQATSSHGDYSSSFAGRTNFALVRGHGNHWLFQCNIDPSNQQLVDLHKMDHYGANSPSGNPAHDNTSYMMFCACSVIPVPGDTFGGYWNSGGVFDVWWNIFWGLHGAYGYHTEDAHNDQHDLLGNVGYDMGFGVPNATAWIDETAAEDHSNGWNYGSLVIPSGREGDCIYDCQALPKATSLTMWWVN